MTRQYLLYTLLLLSALIATAHHTALSLFLYWEFWWFDIVVHFLGGFWVGLAALWLVFYSGYSRKLLTYTKYHPLLVSLAAVIVVGFLWEVFEIVIGLPRAENFISDTLVDVVMDILGAFAAYGYFSMYRSKSLKEEAEGETEVDMIK